ncbi:MAG: hypothetical protein ACN6RA_14840 [Stenotrophomonas maltophilia]
MNADEARRKSEEAGGSGLHSELRDSIYSSIERQAEAGDRSVLFARSLKHPALSYEALFEELKKDGYQIGPGSNSELFVVSW